MRIDLFQMERTQCLYENEVEFNLSESGVLPVRVEELVGGAEGLARLGALGLKYPPSNGSEELRRRIASFYGDAGPENVLVTNGGSEANYTTLWGLLDKGDRAAVMLPNYMQAWGLARAYAGTADAFRLVERFPNGPGSRDGRTRPDGRARWALDTDSLKRAVTRRTKVVVVTNPNNPTGAVLTDDEMDAIVRAARKVGAWIVSDEVYRGAEVQRDGVAAGAAASAVTSPTFWGRYDRVIVTAGLSKAFGMPGLRIGWIVGPAKTLAHLCRYHDYTTLTPTIISERLASIAMEPSRRDALLARTRAIIRRNLPRLEEWIATHAGILTCIPPVAGAIALVRYDLPIASAALFDRLRRERSVLITPGAHFGIGKYIRIGYGYDIDYTLRGLARVDLTLREIGRRRPSARRPAARSASNSRL
jgi:hypothetical protein